MTVRIWHQSFTVLSDLGAYDRALQAHFRKVARPGTEIHMHGMKPGTYRSNYPGDDIKHAALQYLHGLQFMANGLTAEAEGYDAYAISTLPEPALREVRSLLNIPVVGYGESAMFTACLLGRRFGVLVFIDELAELVEENARCHGLADRLAGVRHVGFRFADVLAAFEDPSELIDRFKSAARELIRSGAEVIIPGEAPLNVLLASNGINEVDGVPVLDSLGAWIKQAEAMVDLQRANGTRTCNTGYFSATPDSDRVREIFDFYGLAERLLDSVREEYHEQYH
ncbi:aspartate/glutamate racemase family protein [Marinobacter pelagius]|uniref:aspartate/glutamate racemase family protein n=1 Tax=Marinobacter sp. C7 TaxID=2951363 RepID=UPI001EF0CB5E|nr:aspartate/glutamate racemase family protein [Marinobacter sp. C7]MCG7200272.1 aspartate/glutamate racemase family protein [Marinobacter sp. C7]